MRLSRLIEFLLKVEREDPDTREVLIDAMSESRKIVGIREEGDKIIIKTRERDGNEQS